MTHFLSKSFFCSSPALCGGTKKLSSLLCDDDEPDEEVYVCVIVCH